MSKLCISMAELTTLRPCPVDSRRVRGLLRKMIEDKDHCFTAAEARAAGCTFDDIAWAASAVALKDMDVERRVRLFLSDCSARVLPIFEKRFPDDDRPRRAIQAVRTWARSPDARAARAAWAARAAGAAEAARAARAAGAAGAAEAARAAWAARAAGAAGAAEAARAAWAARAAGAAGAAWAAWAAERDWQFDRLVLWLSDPEPRPLRLPARPMKGSPLAEKERE